MQICTLRYDPRSTMYVAARRATGVSRAHIDISRSSEQRAEGDGNIESKIRAGTAHGYTTRIDRALAVLQGCGATHCSVLPGRRIVAGQPERLANRVIVNPAGVCACKG